MTIETGEKNTMLTSEKMSSLVFGSFDWSQGSTALQTMIFYYMKTKHPEWRVDSLRLLHLYRDTHLDHRVEKKVQGRSHSEVVIHVPQMLDAEIQQFELILNGYIKMPSMNSILADCLSSIIERDLKFLEGRTGKRDKARPAKGHGRVHQSFFCDYVLAALPYPGDEIFWGLATDMRTYMKRTVLPGKLQHDIGRLIVANNEWYEQGLTTVPIESSALDFLIRP